MLTNSTSHDTCATTSLGPQSTISSGIRISNLDSTEQQLMWASIASEYDIDLAKFWDSSSHSASQILHAYPRFYQYLAGVLRTAYLKDTVIVCTWPEIIDGFFMLAIGPTDILKILGISYKDPSPLVIRGNAPTFVQTILNFFVAPAKNDKPRYFKTPNELQRAAIQPILPFLLSSSDSKQTMKDEMNPSTYMESNSDASNFSLPTEVDLPSTIFRKIRILHEQAYRLPQNSLSLIEQRWNEWNQAIEDGLIRYEFFPLDKHPLSLKQTLSEYQPICEHHIDELLDFFKGSHSGDNSNNPLFSGDKDYLRSYTENIFTLNRSETFTKITEKFPPTHSLIGRALNDAYTDFYQFVYQLSIAQQHGTEWISVKLENNDDNTNSGTASPEHPHESTNSAITTDTQNSFIEYMSSHPELSQKYLRTGMKSNTAHADKNNIEKDTTRITTLQFLAGSSSKILSEMPAASFTEFCYTSRESIKQWRQGTLKHVEDIDYAISRASSTHTRSDDFADLKRGGILAFILAVISWIVDQSKDIVDAGLGIWMAPLIALVVTVLPEAINLIHEWRTLKSDTHTLVITPDGR
ncbi:hypothetical protein EJ419_03665 [Alloscardovia theropitheci]|uniref:Uncharacterized protein n=1 Tax=Alloscardovia theropitheci TaxID=2496842 RepID=A0A4R0QPJ9_9BIFI|nr:hypothetical protein [Alloscardovia theropitheci]TCD54154.1 hypothetical protein EJ419_03665 [Alloscardovia theropitheci]